MRTRAIGVKIVVCLLLVTILGVSSYAAKELRKYELHDKTRMANLSAKPE